MRTAGAALLAVMCVLRCRASSDNPEPNPKLAPHYGLHPGRFAGKVCLITGATSGIGEHAAYHLAKEGCAVAVTGRRADKGAQVVDTIGGLVGHSILKPSALFIELDVTKPDSVAAAVAKVNATWGRLDAVFANSGIVNFATLLEQVDPDEFKMVMDVNVNGVFHTIKYTTPLLRQTGPAKAVSGGSIVIDSSIYGLKAGPLLGPYITSKHALEGLKKVAAAEGFPHGVRVNNLNPSFTPSEMTAGMSDLPPLREGVINEMQPDGKMSELGETSAATAYLLSDDSRYVNGMSLPVGAGLENNVMNPKRFMDRFGEAMTLMAAAQEKTADKPAAAKPPTLPSYFE